MNVENDPLAGLPEKDFDQIYDETVDEMCGESAERIQASVEAKMWMRQHEINLQASNDKDRAELEKVELSTELYQGWRIFELADSQSDEHLTFTDFQKYFDHMKKFRPGSLLFFLPLWECAFEYGGETAHQLHEANMKALMEAVHDYADRQKGGKEDQAMMRYISSFVNRED